MRCQSEEKDMWKNIVSVQELNNLIQDTLVHKRKFGEQLNLQSNQSSQDVKKCIKILGKSASSSSLKVGAQIHHKAVFLIDIVDASSTTEGIQTFLLEHGTYEASCFVAKSWLWEWDLVNVFHVYIPAQDREMVLDKAL